jgi:hypothetical protein
MTRIKNDLYKKWLQIKFFLLYHKHCIQGEKFLRKRKKKFLGRNFWVLDKKLLAFSNLKNKDVTFSNHD